MGCEFSLSPFLEMARWLYYTMIEYNTHITYYYVYDYNFIWVDRRFKNEKYRHTQNIQKLLNSLSKFGYKYIIYYIC